MWLSASHNSYKARFPSSVPFFVFFPLAVSCLWPQNCTNINALLSRPEFHEKSLKDSARGPHPAAGRHDSRLDRVLSAGREGWELYSLTRLWGPNAARPPHFVMGFRNLVWKQQRTGLLLDGSLPSCVWPLNTFPPWFQTFFPTPWRGNQALALLIYMK